MTNVDEAATASGDSGDRPDKKSGKKSGKKPMPLWQETILLLVLALLLAIVIKSLFVQAFYIPSPSMEPQFIKNDRILVQKVSYWGSASPSRGDIIVFKDPGGWLDANEGSKPSLAGHRADGEDRPLPDRWTPREARHRHRWRPRRVL